MNLKMPIGFSRCIEVIGRHNWLPRCRRCLLYRSLPKLVFAMNKVVADVRGTPRTPTLTVIRIVEGTAGGKKFLRPRQPHASVDV